MHLYKLKIKYKYGDKMIWSIVIAIYITAIVWFIDETRNAPLMNDHP